jgi:dTDP-glucose 4,6-dehydratase
VKILVTGGAGFIGSNFIRYLLARHAADEVVNLDALKYSGNLETLADIADDPRYRFVHGDIADAEIVCEAMQGAAVVVNFAAESHVDRSIEDPETFLHTNVNGTLVLLQAARRADVQCFVQVSTDEVYGSLGPSGCFVESSPLRPSSPYAASKAAADLLALSFWTTYHLPVVVTRCSNNFGPYQFPEKVIPLFVTNALADELLPLYGDGMNVRDWIYVEDHCAALDLVLRGGRPGEIYNIGASSERSNREVTELILSILDKPLSLIRYVSDRPGHDRRYALDATKMRAEFDWQPLHTFDDALRRTVLWYRDHPTWWQRVKSGEYRTYYQRMYGARLGDVQQRRSAP